MLPARFQCLTLARCVQLSVHSARLCGTTRNHRRSAVANGRQGNGKLIIRKSESGGAPSAANSPWSPLAMLRGFSVAAATWGSVQSAPDWRKSGVSTARIMNGTARTATSFHWYDYIVAATAPRRNVARGLHCNWLRSGLWLWQGALQQFLSWQVC